MADTTDTTGTAAQTKAPVRLDALTSIRVFAALCVFAVHFDAVAGLMPGLSVHTLIRTARDLNDAGVAAASMFFILSGFVLTWSQLSRPKPKEPPVFLRDRLTRIFPNHIVTGIIALLIAGKFALNKTAVPAFLLLQAWIPKRSYYFALNVPSWTLSCELAFYFVFPWLLPALLKVRQRKALIAGLVAIPWALGFLGVKHAYWIYIFPPSRLPEFMIGILLCMEIRDGFRPKVPLVPAFVLLLGVIVVEQHLPTGFVYEAAPLIPVMILVIGMATADMRVSAGTAWLRTRWLVLLGEWTFAFYMIHNLVLLEFAKLVQGDHWPHGDLVTFGLAAALALMSTLCAVALHYVVEKPVRKFLTGLNLGDRFSV